MVGPWIMVDATVYLGVGIAGTFCSKFPYRPIFAVFVIEEFCQSIGRITIGALRISR